MFRFLTLFFLIAVFSISVQGAPEPEKPYSFYKKQLEQSAPNTTDEQLATIYRKALYRLQNLNEPEQYDQLLALVREKYADRIPVLIEMVQLRGLIPSYGYRIGNTFTRGYNRSGTGEYLSSQERDRVAMAKLMLAAMYDPKNSKSELPSAFYLAFASLFPHTDSNLTWQLQAKTELYGNLPELQKERYRAGRPPLNSDGSPIFYALPASFEQAKNDGERLRYLFSKAGKTGEYRYASFLHSQFDPAFIFSYAPAFQHYIRTEEGLRFLNSLSDDETLAWLPDGVRKITLPGEHNYIRFYQKEKAHRTLGEIYQARAQFSRALAEYEAALKVEPTDLFSAEWIQKIKGNYGTLFPVKGFPAGQNPRVELLFRNAKSASVTIRKLKKTEMIASLLKTFSTPQKEFEPNLFTEKNVPFWTSRFKDFIGAEVANFQVNLNPKPDYFDTTGMITLPIQDSGWYLVRVSLKDGNVTEMIISLSRYVLTMAQASNQPDRLLLNHAITGAPVPNTIVNLHYFNTIYAQDPEDIKKFGKVRIEYSNQKSETLPDGSIVMPENAKGFLLAETTVAGESVLYSGSAYPSRMRHGSASEYNSTSAFFITDRPIYKPGDSVEFSAFIRKASYLNETPLVYPASLSVTVYGPFNKKLYTAKMPVSQKTGAIAGRFRLPADAALGYYRIHADGFGGGISFRVEEYKKPEFRVSIEIPKEPVKLGESFSTIISAQYYFGQPVTDAPIVCKVFREKASPYFPLVSQFDWLYGRGYVLPSTSFALWRFFPYYLERDFVGEFSGKTSEKGIFECKINSSGLKEKFGETNYRYIVSASVSDSSRRVISAEGSVLAVAKPFHVFVYPLQGFTGVNDLTTIRIVASSPDGKEMNGRGFLKIFRRKINADGKWEREGACLKTVRFESGETPSFHIDRSGVYEAFAEFHAKNGIMESGSCTFRVRGNQTSGKLFSDLPLELSTDRATYRPGDTAEILISCNKPGSTVYLFTLNQMRMISIKGYSEIVTIPIQRADLPNTFVSALLIRDTDTTYLTKQLYIPPESKLLNVNISVPKGSVKPRSSVPVELRVTGLDGKPVSGAFAVTVYDKSLEGLAADNVASLNSFFWGWKRWFFCNFFNDLSFRSFPYSQKQFKPLIFGNRFQRYDSWAFSARDKYESNGFAMPFAAALDSPRKMAMKEKSTISADSAGRMEAGGEEMSPVTVRSDFQDRAFWIGQRMLDSDGKASFSVPVPDNLTTWAVKVWSLTPDTKVGQGNAEFIVSKDFIARLELPRFLITGDVVEARAIIHNYTEKTVQASLNLSSPSGLLEYDNKISAVSIASGKSVTVPFRLKARAPGRAELVLTAKANGTSDAVLLPLPILVRGSEVSFPASGRLENQNASISFTVPRKIRRESLKQQITFAPGAAVAMVDLLPYLAADDSFNAFGIVNRFLPALSAKYALETMGVPFATAIGGLRIRDSLYQNYLSHSSKKPVFDASHFEEMIRKNLTMIQGMVNGDGGWGWFSGYRETSYPDTTAYVVDALLTAKKMKMPVREDLLRHGIEWLTRHAEVRCGEIEKKISPVSNIDAMVLRTLADAGKRHIPLETLTMRDRKDLSSYGKIVLGLALPKQSPEVSVILTELSEQLKTNAENGTAYLNIEPGWSFFWYGSETATQASYLQLLIRETPKSSIIEPLARYLTVNVRNAPSRSSIRALGTAVRALAEYSIFARETNPDLTVSIRLDNGHEKRFRITKENLWSGSFEMEIPSALLSQGSHTLQISCSGRGAVYYHTMLSYFTLEEKIPPTGLEMKLERKYYRLDRILESSVTPGSGSRLQTLHDEKYTRIPLKDLSSVLPGTLVEVELIATTQNDYDYVEFSDRIPAGFEYENPTSGYLSRGPAIYAEFRETGPRFSQRELRRGVNSIRYRLRAQLDGSYLALPASGKGIYAPALRCNTAETRLNIKQE